MVAKSEFSLMKNQDHTESHTYSVHILMQKVVKQNQKKGREKVRESVK